MHLLDSGAHIAVVTQDVASRDRLRALLADHVGGAQVTIDAALRFQLPTA